MKSRICTGALTACVMAAQTPLHASETEKEQTKAFSLGQITVTAARSDALAITSETITSQAMVQFQRHSLDDAVSLMPGVSASNSGGSRNERLIFVRGFERTQVPLSIDGIRVYLPADGRTDYGRFLTADVSEVQVVKGYASVLDGPGAMGGAINLVTRTPSKALEGEARGTLTFDNSADYAGYNVFALLGTRQEKWYTQASYTRNFRDHWGLPGSYAPTSGSAENGGEREFSRSADWRVNAKVGFTPNANDEYSISYTRQEGSKNAPLHITDTVNTQRNWSWPYWNIDSLYFLSKTALGENATLKTRIYRNGFDNLLRAYDDASQTVQSRSRAFNSYYDDTAWGGSAQLDVLLTPANRFSLAAHYRRDKHVEWQQSFPSSVTEPRQISTESTYSMAAENKLQFSPQLALTLGASFDWRDLHRAEDYTDNAFVTYPLYGGEAFNAQGQLMWTPDSTTSMRASISSRARFPTLFERFSSRFGGTTSNPSLKAERATNYEIGGTHDMGALRLEGSLFYSELNDAIVAFPFIHQGQAVSQSRNVGSGKYYGGEIALTARVSSSVSVGGNYTYTHRDLNDPSIAAFKPLGVPTHKAFIWADWSPLPGVHILPNADIASDQWTVTTAGTRYYRTGGHVLANITVNYAINDAIEISLGARNLFDEYYVLTDGFPEQGRSLFASVRTRF